MSIRSKQLIYKDQYQYILWTDDINMDIHLKDVLIADGLQIKCIYDEVPKLVVGDQDWIHWGCGQGTSFGCDYYRFQLLYKLGGIYSDLDSIAISEIPYHWLLCEFFCDTEYNEGVIPTGIVIGYFLCKPECDFIYKYRWLRRHLDVNYITNMQLGLLCSDTKGTVISDQKEFIPISWKLDQLSAFLNSDERIADLNSTELHLYGDAIQKVPNGIELANKKLKDYELYLNNK